MREDNDGPLASCFERILEPGQLLVIDVHLMRTEATQHILLSQFVLHRSPTESSRAQVASMMHGAWCNIIILLRMHAHLNALDLKRTVEMPMHRTSPSSMDQ